MKKIKVNDRLQRTYRNGTAKLAGNLEDYGFFIQTLLDLYEASGDTR